MAWNNAPNRTLKEVLAVAKKGLDYYNRYRMGEDLDYPGRGPWLPGERWTWSPGMTFNDTPRV